MGAEQRAHCTGPFGRRRRRPCRRRFSPPSASTPIRCETGDVTTHLLRAHGIARYEEDSYFGPDYRTIPPEKRTIDLRNDIISRSAFACRVKEANWCIFDSVISVFYGRRFLEDNNPDNLHRQLHYLRRCLHGLVPAEGGRLLLPEAWFMENGRYVPNDHIPLQWAHANLWRAVVAMEKAVLVKQIHR